MDFSVLFGISAVVITFLLFLIGKLVSPTRSWQAVLVDQYRRLSLTRLQVVMWTIIILGAYTAASFVTGSADLEIPTEVWALLGITVGGGAGTVIVQSTRDTATVSPQMASRARADGGANVGRSHVASAPRLSQLFTGEEVGDFHIVDISKVQMFFFTVAVAVAYIQALLGNEWSATHAFPPLSEGVVTLIGISHAGYLSVASTSKSTAPEGALPPAPQPATPAPAAEGTTKET